jgi:hemoglobin-like flavoprotein
MTNPNPNSLSILKDLSTLAELYTLANDLTKAEALYVKILQLEKARIPSEEGMACNALAEFYLNHCLRTKAKLAEELFQEALLKTPEEESLDTITILHNLANLYLTSEDVGFNFTRTKTPEERYDIAEKHLARAAKIVDTLGDAAQSKVSDCLSNSAALSYARYCQTKAEGVVSEDSAESVEEGNLTSKEERLVDIAYAENLLLQALELNQAEDSSDILTRLGLVCQIQEKYEIAETYLIKALTLRQALYEPNHPKIIASVRNLANLIEAQGRNIDAAEMLSEAKTDEINYRKTKQELIAPAVYKLIYKCKYQGEPDLANFLESISAMFSEFTVLS